MQEILICCSNNFGRLLHQLPMDVGGKTPRNPDIFGSIRSAAASSRLELGVELLCLGKMATGQSGSKMMK